VDTSPESPNHQHGFRFVDVDDSIAGLDTDDFVLDDEAGQNSKDYADLEAGRYRIVLTDPADGFELLEITCANAAGLGGSTFNIQESSSRATVDLAANSRVTCTFELGLAAPTPTPVPPTPTAVPPTPVPTATPVPATAVPATPSVLCVINGQILPIQGTSCPPTPAAPTPAPAQGVITPPRTGDAGLVK
jgi:hypothetical protein